MLYKWAKLLSLAVLLNGLCPPAQANTTIAAAAAGDVANPTIPIASIALLLPSRSGPLGAAAEALRAGFVAAYERDKSGLALTVIEAADTPADMLSTYLAASENHDILVGPLSRTGITAIVRSGKIVKPTLALTQPDFAGDKETALPPQLLPIGLSLEAEARQVANWVSADFAPGKAFVLSTSTAWQRRAASAFVQQALSHGLHSAQMTLRTDGAMLNAAGLAQLQQRIQSEKPQLLFAALNADQARQVRSAIDAEIPIYGISQLNPLLPNDNNQEHRLPELDGVRLLDIPWLVQPDHPAVMIYPRTISDPDQQRNADLERLYALGIDAFRIAREVAARNTAFQVDGVTGKLDVHFGIGVDNPGFERVEPAAVYRDGVVVPLDER
ncbi:penicillin-binding protein activator [Paraherbaspirillum soli]|uniref:Penicillin-binding protein activator n=1 Tax=Paraherbaspirillum soli TaxID=631222 RepID=A0ABW0M4P8_9BURK